MGDLLAAPFAPLFELNFARYQLAILARPVVDTTTLGAAELYELILRHARHYTRKDISGQLANSVPRQTARRPCHHDAHEDIDHKPGRENDDKAYEDTVEQGLRFSF